MTVAPNAMTVTKILDQRLANLPDHLMTIDKRLANVTPTDFLEYLSDTYGFTLEYNSVMKARFEDKRTILIPRMKNVRVGTLVLLAIETNGGTYRYTKGKFYIYNRTANTAPLAKTAEQLRGEAAMRAKLNRICTIDKPIQNATLQDVLDYIGEQMEINFYIDDESAEKMPYPLHSMREQSVRMTPQSDKLSKILKSLLDRLGHVTYKVHSDYIRIGFFPQDHPMRR